MPLLADDREGLAGHAYRKRWTRPGLLSYAIAMNTVPIPLHPSDPPLDCPACPRLVAYRQANRATAPGAFNAPVPSWGPLDARLLVVGLAPGVKGANTTGRPFTGDHAGWLLYETLVRHGFASGTFDAKPDDSLELRDVRVTNAVRCVPPQNKPTAEEIKTCTTYLSAVIGEMTKLESIVCLGKIAHDALSRALGIRLSANPFGHGAVYGHDIAGCSISVYDSYHCSRYNTNTRVLTPAMFSDVFARVAADLL